MRGQPLLIYIILIFRYISVLPKEDPAVLNIASELCSNLIKTKSSDALAVFLEQLPDTREYRSNESVIRAKIHVALLKKETTVVYQLLQENHFVNGEDLIKVWDEALYIDEERRTKKKLTPLSRFRVRKRYPPPKSICADGVRKTNTLPREATNHLKAWLMAHISDPYPNASENQALAKASGLTQAQVKTWFANARRRGKNTEEFQKRIKSEPTYTTPSHAGPLVPIPQSPLLHAPMPQNSSYYPNIYNNNDFFPQQMTTTHTTHGATAWCEYYQCYLSTYNLHHQGVNGGFNTHQGGMRIWRPDQGGYYDAAMSRSMIEFATKTHHQVEYSTEHNDLNRSYIDSHSHHHIGYPDQGYSESPFYY